MHRFESILFQTFAVPDLNRTRCTKAPLKNLCHCGSQYESEPVLLNPTSIDSSLPLVNRLLVDTISTSNNITGRGFRLGIKTTGGFAFCLSGPNPNWLQSWYHSGCASTVTFKITSRQKKILSGRAVVSEELFRLNSF